MIRQLDRWFKARDAEKDFWAQKDVKALKTAGDWEDFLRQNFGLTYASFNGKAVLEVGCGPYGLIHFISSCVSVGVDPLSFDAWRGNGRNHTSTAHIVATGEYLPFRNNAFDFCLCFNVLDHTILPKDVMHEIVRILKSNGELLLWVHAIHSWLRVIGPFLSLVDKSHPHHFTFQRVINLITESTLEVISIEKKNMIKGDFIQKARVFLRVPFKLAMGSLLIFNIFVRTHMHRKNLASEKIDSSDVKFSC